MATDHIQMLCDIGELNSLVVDSTSIDKMLSQIVIMVAQHIHADVCSVYLYDDQQDLLILKATHGLNSNFVDKVRLKPGEGLVGYAMEKQTIVSEKDARKSPHFKQVNGLDEEPFAAFLAIPIKRGNVQIGVIVLQRKDNVAFSHTDSMALQATASQLVSMLEHAKVLLSLTGRGAVTSRERQMAVFQGSSWKPQEIRLVKGRVASEGYARAEMHHLLHETLSALIERIGYSNGYSVADLSEAVAKTQQQLEDLQQRVEEKLSDAASLIFSSHLMMLKDKGYIGKIESLIESGVPALKAVQEVFDSYRNIFENIQDQLIREKIKDIEDVSKRIVSNLTGQAGEAELFLAHIVVTKDLFPSDLLRLSAEEVSGIILVGGGITSHVAILARSLKIPMIIVDDNKVMNLPDNTNLLMDAELGNIYIDPDKEVIENFDQRNLARINIERDDHLLQEPTVTADGTKIHLYLNINLLTDILNIGNIVYDGIGLYRTEFPFMIRNDFPTEEEQLVIYSKLINAACGRTITFRTLDIGGDKVLSYYQTGGEENPFLGMRSIRFSLKHHSIFKQQIRAILRASHDCNIRIMFPMISSIEELRMAKAILRECVVELKAEKLQCNETPSIGLMIEIPAVMAILDELAAESDFFSIGTNDLIQYTLAVDRTNDKVADMYIPHHPAIIRSLALVERAARKHGIEVSVCGDMAKDPKYIPLLVGLGLTSLSVDAVYLSRVKRIVSNLTIKNATSLARKILRKASCSEIYKTLEDFSC
jgi:phosphotransferase system enzyme I (PtsP)